jgi:hypothetical protein
MTKKEVKELLKRQDEFIHADGIKVTNKPDNVRIVLYFGTGLESGKEVILAWEDRLEEDETYEELEKRTWKNLVAMWSKDRNPGKYHYERGNEALTFTDLKPYTEENKRSFIL